MATKKPPKRRTAQQENVYRKLHPPAAEPEPDELEEEEDLEDQPATPELIAKLGFNPDDDEPPDPEFWE